MLYTIRLLDKEGCEIYVDDVRGLKAAKARAVEMLTDPEPGIRDSAARVEVLDPMLVVIWDKAATAQPVSDATAAANARALLAQLTTDGRVDHKAFLNEMDARSVATYGHKLKPKQQRLLARIVAAYEAEIGAS